MFIKPPSGGRDGNRPVAARKQQNTQLLLQLPDLLGDGRLRNVMRFRGPGEIQGLRKCYEIGYLLQFHKFILSLSIVYPCLTQNYQGV